MKQPPYTLSERASISVSAAAPCPSCGWDGCTCRKCHGAGWVVLERWTEGKEQVKAPCPTCNERQVNDQRQERLVGESGLSKFRTVSFDSSGPRPGQEPAWFACLDFANRPKGWILLHGDPGVGKTHIAMCVGNVILDTQHRALFRIVPLLLKELRSTFNAESEMTFDARFDALCKVPLMILDDLGAEQPTQWAKETLYVLLNQRWLDQAPTVITTNLHASAIDQRVWSRMRDSDLVQSIEVRAGSRGGR